MDKTSSPPAKKPRRSKTPKFKDPDVPFPATESYFNGVPPDAMAECLAVWHVLASFGRPLRIGPDFHLDDFTLALAYPHRTSLLDTAHERLVAAALADPDLAVASSHSRSRIPDTWTEVASDAAPLRNGLSTSRAHASDSGPTEYQQVFAKARPDGEVERARTMREMPEDVWPEMVERVLRGVQVRGGESAWDGLSLHTVRGLRNGGLQRYDELKGMVFARLAVLAALADAAMGADALRLAMDNDMDAAAETRRSEREGILKSKRAMNDQLKDLKEQLEAYRSEHNLDTAANSSEVTMPEADEIPVHLSRTEKLDRARRLKEKHDKTQRILRDEAALVDKITSLKRRLEHLRTKLAGGSVASDSGVGAGRSRGRAAATDGLPEENDADTCGFRVRPLGFDRKKRVYYFFPGEGRLFLEDGNTARWSYLTTKDSLDSLFNWLNPERRCERLVKASLTRNYEFIVAAMRQRKSRLSGPESGLDNGRRRSGRKRSDQPVASFLTWTNKWQGD